MIIKSMARKQPSFAQLVQYFHKPLYGRKAQIFAHNIYESASPERAIAELEHNATFLPKRANGNFCYHEIIALEECSEISRFKQERILFDLVRRYVSIRAPRQLVYGRMHLDKNLHFHLCISANAARGKQRIWLSKAQFANIQSELERYKLEKYPELGSRSFYGQRGKHKQFQAENDYRPIVRPSEFEYSKRTGNQSRKEQLRSLLLPIFANASGLEILKRNLTNHDIGYYCRGKTEGIVDYRSGKRYRLKTLGLSFAAFVIRERKQLERGHQQPKLSRRMAHKEPECEAGNDLEL